MSEVEVRDDNDDSTNEEEDVVKVSCKIQPTLEKEVKVEDRVFSCKLTTEATTRAIIPLAND